MSRRLTGRADFELITEIKTFHQAQKDGVQAALIRNTLIIFGPDAGQVGVGQNTTRRPDRFVGQNTADGFGDPIGLEHDKITQIIIILKVEDFA